MLFPLYSSLYLVHPYREPLESFQHYQLGRDKIVQAAFSMDSVWGFWWGTSVLTLRSLPFWLTICRSHIEDGNIINPWYFWVCGGVWPDPSSYLPPLTGVWLGFSGSVCTEVTESTLSTELTAWTVSTLTIPVSFTANVSQTLHRTLSRIFFTTFLGSTSWILDICNTRFTWKTKFVFKLF